MWFDKLKLVGAITDGKYLCVLHAQDISAVFQIKLSLFSFLNIRKM